MEYSSQFKHTEFDPEIMATTYLQQNGENSKLRAFYKSI